MLRLKDIRKYFLIIFIGSLLESLRITNANNYWRCMVWSMDLSEVATTKSRFFGLICKSFLSIELDSYGMRIAVDREQLEDSIDSCYQFW